jgi:hypothetical protein
MILVCCRFSSLVRLDVVYSSVNTIAFQGQGVGPSEQRSSLQQQLALFASSPVLLAPASWPSQCCLTKLTIAITPSTRSLAHNGVVGAMLYAAVQTRSLCHLSLRALPPPQLQTSFFEALPALTNLKHLTCAQTTAGGPLAAAAHLPSLRSLRVNAHPSSDIILPSGTAHLPLLTELVLLCPGASLDLQQLSGFTSLRALVVKDATCRGRLLDIFALSQLTTLTLPRIHAPSTAQDGAAPQQEVQQQVQQQVQQVQQQLQQLQQQQAAATKGPAAWRLGLQALSWHEPVALLPQLAGLTRLWLYVVEISPKFFWYVHSVRAGLYTWVTINVRCASVWQSSVAPDTLHSCFVVLLSSIGGFACPVMSAGGGRSCRSSLLSEQASLRPFAGQMHVVCTPYDVCCA